MNRGRLLTIPVLVLIASLGSAVDATAEPGMSSLCVTDGRADVTCTPGAVNPDVTQDTINDTICVSGWTRTVRPPASYTTALKNQQKVDYGEEDIPNSGLEEDHLIPLELGGAPRDPANLWPEPRGDYAPQGYSAEDKDREENSLKRQVCDGGLTLGEAQQQILADWTH